MHVVVLASKRRMPLGAYVAAWKQCRDLVRNGHGDVKLSQTPNSTFGGTVAQALKELRAGLADRINRHIPGYGRGRKWTDEWYWDAKRTAQAVNTPKLAIHWLPRDLRRRLAHRLTEFHA